MKKFEYIISACLLGIPCRWDGTAKINNKALKIFLKGKSLAVCPEIMAGLPTPRPACEIFNGAGNDVLNNKAKIVDINGKSYNTPYVKGAKYVLSLVEKYKINKAILKSGSPSCGVNYIYSGNFDGKKKRGEGIMTALLNKKLRKIVEI